MKTIYVEDLVADHPRVRRIIARYPGADIVPCARYQQVFNPKSQSFRQQKQLGPALILAHKSGRRVLSAPSGFGIGHANNFYFSHMLNCLYDCRYCFLQGMYKSANYVLFVNYEDFMDDLDKEIANHPDNSCVFFSGYDCDSLAMDSLTGFLDCFLPYFRTRPQATLELRTKSTQVRSLLTNKPMDNCVVAFSFTPEEISAVVEHKVPPYAKRLAALRSVVAAGWPIGLRFDPMIYAANFQELYARLIADLMAIVPAQQLHSVSVGALRFPAKMLDELQREYPNDRLLAYPFVRRKGVSSYAAEVEREMKSYVRELLAQHVDKCTIFECEAG